MTEKKFEETVETVETPVFSEIVKIQETIEGLYTTAGMTLPAIVVGEIVDSVIIESARKSYEQMTNDNPQDEDIMDAQGNTRKQLRELYMRGVPLTSNDGLDNEAPIKHTIDVRLEDGRPVIEVNSNMEGSTPVIIATPPSNPSSTEGVPTEATPISTTAFPSQEQVEEQDERNRKAEEEQQVSDNTKTQVAETKIGTQSPTVAAVPVEIPKPSFSPDTQVDNDIK